MKPNFTLALLCLGAMAGGAAAPCASAAEHIINGGFDDWSGGTPVGWSRVNGVTATEVPLGEGNSVLQLASGSSNDAQAVLQTFTGFGGGFLVKMTFSQQAPAGGARGMNISLRTGGTPLLSFRSSATGTLEVYNGATSVWVGITGTAGAISPADYMDGNNGNDPLYRMEVEASLADATYTVRLYHVTGGTLVSSISGLAYWQNTPTAASQLQAIHLERGRSGADWRAYEVSVEDTGTADPFVVNPDPTHPFLIVSAEEYPEWRQRALVQPWAGTRAKALAAAATLTYDPAYSGPYRSKVLRLKTVVSSCALAAILDPANGDTYARKAAEQMIGGLTNIRDTRGAIGGWDANTPVGSTLFSCILALDVLHPLIDPAARTQIENLIGPLVNAISGWDPSPASVRCLWALYRGDAAAYQSNVSSYLSQLLVYFTDDGVMLAGTGYGNARMNYYDREQKHALVDILSRLGAVDGYSLAKVRRMYEWLYGSAYGHQGQLHIFGDTSPNRPLWGPPGEYPVDSPTAAYAAWHFSAAAQSYANRLIADPSPQPSLLGYALLGAATRDIPPTSAPSRIFPKGGAFFREATAESGGLSSGLLNLTSYEGHTHKEVNSLSLIGHGENLISNSGYAGYATGSLGYSWDYINNRAISGNTVFIDYPVAVARTAPATGDHLRKYGAGIVRGLVTPVLDYAVGDSGGALAAGVHQRGMAFVQPDAEAGVPGYWFLLDRVTSSAGTGAQMALHPFSAEVTTISANESYRWFIRRDTADGTYLTLRLAAPPSQTQLLDGVFANLDPAKSFVGKFLYATYPIQSGAAHFATAILPHRTMAGSPAGGSLSGPGFRGMSLTWGSVTDRIFTADAGAGPLVSADTSWDGTGCYARSGPGGLISFMVDNGVSFAQGGALFTSTIPCLAVGGADGLRISAASATTVRFRWPGVSVAFLDDSSDPLAADAAGAFSLDLSAGTHLLRPGLPMKPAYDLSIRGDTVILGVRGMLPGKGYRHETSTDLRNWSVLRRTTAAPLSTDLLADPVDAPARFYRIIQE